MAYTVTTRQQWGATPSKQSPPLTAWIGWVLHWRDATPVGITPGRDLIRQAERYHEGTKGWADIAYHFGVDRNGGIFQGRDLGRQGAATYGRNKNTMAIVFLFGQGELTDAAVDAARWIIHVHGPANGHLAKIAGPHSAFRPTQCPGDQIRAALTAGRFDSAPAVSEEKAVTHPKAAEGGPLIALWMEELQAINFAVRGRALNEQEVRAWTEDLVLRVYVRGEGDLSGVARWFHWKLTTSTS